MLSKRTSARWTLRQDHRQQHGQHGGHGVDVLTGRGAPGRVRLDTSTGRQPGALPRRPVRPCAGAAEERGASSDDAPRRERGTGGQRRKTPRRLQISRREIRPGRALPSRFLAPQSPYNRFPTARWYPVPPDLAARPKCLCK